MAVPSWINSLSDATIRADLTADAADGVFTFAEARDLLKDVAAKLGSAGLSAARFGDLETVATNLGNGLYASSYVESVFSKCVLGADANYFWTAGKTDTYLGDLYVGSSAGQLTKLIGKWFLGTDLPTPYSEWWSTVTYQATTLPLFAAAGPTIADINQTALGDCYFLATLGEVAYTNPTLIRSMFQDNGDGTYGVRFYNNGMEDWVTVNNQLPTGNYSDNYSTTAMWADLAEKAFAQWQTSSWNGNSYDTIGNGGDPAWALQLVTGASNVQTIEADYINLTPNQWMPTWKYVVTPELVAAALDSIDAALAAHCDVLLTSNLDEKDAAGKDTLISNHEFYVTDVDIYNGTVTVRNPWGTLGKDYVTSFDASVEHLLENGACSFQIDDVYGPLNIVQANAATVNLSAKSYAGLDTGSEWFTRNLPIDVFAALSGTPTTITASMADLYRYATLIGSSGVDTLALGDAVADLRHLTLSSIEVIQATNKSGATFTITQDQLAAGGSVIGGAGTDTLVAAGPSLDLGTTTLSGVEVVKAGCTSDTTVTLGPGALAGLKSIIGNDGQDTLVVNGGNVNLAATTVKGIEVIEAGGIAATTFTVAQSNLADVICMFGTGGDTLVASGTSLDLSKTVITGIKILKAGSVGTTFTLRQTDIFVGNGSIVGSTGTDTIVSAGNSLNLGTTTLSGIEVLKVGDSVGTTLTLGSAVTGLTSVAGGTGLDTLVLAGSHTAYAFGKTGTTAGSGVFYGNGAWVSFTGLETVRFGDGASLSLSNPGAIATAAADTLTGTSATDIMIGLGGNDTLNGGAGADTLLGGAGDDVYVVDNSLDTVIEVAKEGTDTVLTALTACGLAADVENLTFTGSGGFTGTGNDLANVITGGAGADVLDGGAGADTLRGGDGNDTYVVDDAKDVIVEGTGTDEIRAKLAAFSLAKLPAIENLTFAGSSGGFTGTGNDGANVITGGAGKDTLDGGKGDDTLVGKGGDDVLKGGDGTDLAVFSGSAADYAITRTGLGAYTVAGAAGTATLTDIEQFKFGTGAAISFAQAHFGTALKAVAGNVYSIMGAMSDAAYLDDATARQTAVGNWRLLGASDLGATLGTGTLSQGLYKNGNAAALVADAVLDGKTTLVLAFRGSDDAQDWLDDFGNINGHFDRLTALVSAVKAAAGNYDQVLVTGHSLGGAMAQMFMTTTADTTVAHYLGSTFGSPGTLSPKVKADDRLVNFRMHDDQIPFMGEHRKDIGTYLKALGTADQTAALTDLANLIGEPGLTADSLKTLVPLLTANQTIVGRNMVFSPDDIALTDNLNMNVADHDLAVYRAYVAAALALGVDFGTGANTILAADGSHTVINAGWGIVLGTSNGETLTGTAKAEAILSGGGADILNGLAGNDTLDGGAGADSMTGGAGDDVYVVDNAGDVVTEALGEGTDTVRTALSTLTLAANVEKLVYTGSGGFTGTGNDLANVITGKGGNDVLDGGLGADTLDGGAGNDVYVVDDAKDVVIDSAGTDEIRSKLASFSLAKLAFIENLSSNLNGAFVGTGNDGANLITGGAGKDTLDGGKGDDTLVGGAEADTLIGGAGNDTLTGGDGADVFRITKEGLDLITDFVHGTDRLGLGSAAFGKITAVTDAMLHFGAHADAAAERFIYDSAAKTLYYDDDGNGAHAQVAILQFSGTVDLSLADLLVF
ncbi:MAG: C2 family cysteine protease [Solirubrobacterales bacterium]